jgi:hypothetical protein
MAIFTLILRAPGSLNRHSTSICNQRYERDEGKKKRCDMRVENKKETNPMLNLN